MRLWDYESTMLRFSSLFVSWYLIKRIIINVYYSCADHWRPRYRAFRRDLPPWQRFCLCPPGSARWALGPHTKDVSLLVLCGGWVRPRSCRRWNTAAWDLVTESLREDRASHTFWTTTDGSLTYLMGAWSYKTYEIKGHENGIITSFVKLSPLGKPSLKKKQI